MATTIFGKSQAALTPVSWDAACNLQHQVQLTLVEVLSAGLHRITTPFLGGLKGLEGVLAQPPQRYVMCTDILDHHSLQSGLLFRVMRSRLQDS